MKTALTILLVISCLGLIASVLLQSGKSAGISGSISGGAEQLFGKQKAQGYDKLFDKITKISAISFILCALVIVIIQ